MEAVHETNRTAMISDLVSVREFRNVSYIASCFRFNIKEELRCKFDERMMRYFGDQDMLTKQKQSCSAKLLDSEGDNELDIKFCTTFAPPKNNKLLTLKFQAQDMGFRNRIEWKVPYKEQIFHRSRYKHRNISLRTFPRKRKANCTEPKFVPVEHPEVILTVQIYRPQEMQTIHLVDQYTFDRSSLRVDQEFLVLGCQNLTEVRDAIICSSDAAIVGEFSEDPHSTANKTFQEIYKSGFFYINGVFYNDMRDPQNKDYSRPIREWCKTARRVGPFTVAKMEETKFIDLEIQLGEPYLYQHQGHCEHVLVFSDLRLMGSRDRQNLMDYPLSQLLHLKSRARCMACLQFVAKWVTTEDSRMCELPFFFCDNCFMAFNYDAKGNKIADFKAHKYVDRSTLF